MPDNGVKGNGKNTATSPDDTPHHFKLNGFGPFPKPAKSFSLSAKAFGKENACVNWLLETGK
jgi:hypothetical protein